MANLKKIIAVYVLALLYLGPLLVAKAWADPLACETFATEDVEHFTIQFDDDNYTPNTAAQKFVTSPRRGDSGYALHYFGLEGTNERIPAQLNMDGTQFTAVFGESEIDEGFFEWWEYWDSNYDLNQGQKIFRTGFWAEGQPAETRELGLVHLHGQFQVNVFCGLWGDSTKCNIGSADNTGIAVARDQWVKLGVWWKYNTPGETDGWMRAYYNGDLLGAVEGDIRGENVKGSNYMWIGGNYSFASTTGTMQNDSNRYIDDVCVYATKEGDGPDPDPEPGVIVGGGFPGWL